VFNNKKGKIMRHPYATIVVLGLATVGAISITSKVKQFFKEKSCCVGNMFNGIKQNHEM
jgi:hypothetical protein